MRKDGQTDMTKLIVAFLNFAYSSKNQSSITLQARLFRDSIRRQYRSHRVPFNRSPLRMVSAEHEWVWRRGKQHHFTNDDRIPQVNTKPPLNNAIKVHFM